METIDIGNRTGSVLRINRKSDFPLGIRLAERDFPDCDFTLRATSGNGFTVFKAERRNGICTHCKVSNGQLVVFFDNHNLGSGRIKIEVFIDYPDENYSDGYRRECYSVLSNIELVDDNGDALKLGLPDPIVTEKEVVKEKKSILVWQI
ncbi:hypothetical protein [Prevotella melaninogenica]